MATPLLSSMDEHQATCETPLPRPSALTPSLGANPPPAALGHDYRCTRGCDDAPPWVSGCPGQRRHSAMVLSARGALGSGGAPSPSPVDPTTPPPHPHRQRRPVLWCQISAPFVDEDAPSLPRNGPEKHKRLRTMLLLIVLCGASMVIGDGVLTPAISGGYLDCLSC